MSSLSLGKTGVAQIFKSIGNMASKRAGSKDTIESSTGDVVQQVSMRFPVYIDTHFFIKNDLKIAWEEINTIFVGNFVENLEDRHVYVNIHKSGLYKVACRHPTFLCIDMIHWIVSHTDPKMMILSSVEDYQQIYHFPQLVNEIDAPFYTLNSRVNTRHILKCLVWEP